MPNYNFIILRNPMSLSALRPHLVIPRQGDVVGHMLFYDAQLPVSQRLVKPR